MTTEPITRPEFTNALEGLRRELQAMGEHIGGDLGLIRAQLTSLLEVHQMEGREVGELKVRVEQNGKDIDGLYESRRQDRNNRWGLYVAIAVALLGHLLNILKGAK